MKKICISFIVLFLVGGMLLFGCSNSAAQINNAVDSSVASETQQKQTESQKSLNPKLVEIYNNGIKGYVKFDKDGKLWEKYNGSDQIRETSELIDYNIYRIYETDTKKTEYVSTIKTNMNNNTVLSEEYEKVIDNSSTKISIDEYNEIKNIFESMKDYYDELLNSNISFNENKIIVNNENKIRMDNANNDLKHFYNKDKYLTVLKVLDGYEIDKINGFNYGFAKYSYKTDNKELKYGYLDINANIITAPQNCEFGNKQIGQGLIPFMQNGKWGFCNIEGKIIIDAKYDDVSFYGFREGLCGVKIGDKWGFIDKSGNIVIEANYEGKDDSDKIDSVYVVNYSYGEGLAPVKKDGKYGYIDKNGNAIIDFQFQYASSFSDGLAAVAKNDKFAFIDKEGNVIIDYSYDKAFAFNDGMAVIAKDEKYNYVNKRNEAIITVKYDRALTIRENICAVKKNNKWGYIDNNGNEIIQCIFDEANQFENGLSTVKFNGVWLLISYENPMVYGYKNEFIENEKAKIRSLDQDGVWDKYYESYSRLKNIQNWQDEDYKNDLSITMINKEVLPDAWYSTNAGLWYYFENDRTTTKKGWFTDSRDDQTYYLNPKNGIMAVGWTTIDGEEYYFNESHDNEPNWYEVGDGIYESYGKKVKAYGSMYRDEETPDGKRVDADGKLVN